MKICLYLEYYHFAGGRLFKNIGTGLISSYKNQKVILGHLGISYTENPKEDYDIFQCNTPWLNSVRLMRRAKKRGKKVIVWSHTTVEDSVQVFRIVKYIAPLYRRYLTFAYNLADLIFAPTEYTRGLLINYGINPDKIVAISNGIDLNQVYFDQKKQASGKKRFELENRLAIITVGLAIPRKGIDTFVSLAARFPELQFRWYGKIYNNLLAKALPKTTDNLRFTGYVPDVLESYSSGDIFIFPSYEENEGMVILEAAACGLPIVVRDIPVYAGWLRHEENCLKADNQPEFEQMLQRLVEDPGLRKKLGENAYELAQKKSVPAIAKQTEQVYQRLLATEKQV